MASTRTRHGRTTGLYRDAQGRQRSAGTFNSEREALTAARHREALANPFPQVTLHRAEKRGRPTVAGYAPKWLDGHRLEETSRETYGSLANRIIGELGDVALADLDPATVRAFFRKLEKSTLSAGSVRHVRTVLSEMCKTAVIDGLMDANPCASVKLKTESTAEMLIATPAQANAIRAFIGADYKLLVETMFATGMRYSELMGLRPCDVDICGAVAVVKAGRSVIVEVGGRPVHRDYGKSKNASRDIKIPADLGQRILAVAGDGWIFRAQRGGYLSRTNFRRIWKRACADAGIRALRVHDARHSHISWLANDPKVPLANVRDRAGHSSLAVTSRYVHVMAADTDPCLDALQRAVAA
ncbi:MAG: tyrosine-type recombinase/integrase [Streptosporangiaceae bacterium]